MCAGTGKEVHIIIFTRARSARKETKARKEKKERELQEKKGIRRKKRGKERIKSKRTPVREKRKFGHPL